MSERRLSADEAPLAKRVAESPQEPTPPVPESGPRAVKTTMPPPPLSETGAPVQREFGKVAPGVPGEVTGPVRREEPPWPGEQPVAAEKEELEPGGDPAMRARRYGDLGTDKDEVMGQQFAEEQ